MQHAAARRGARRLRVEGLEGRTVPAGLGAVAVDGTDRVLLFDPSTDATLATVAVPALDNNNGVAVSPDRTRVAVSSFLSG